MKKKYKFLQNLDSKWMGGLIICFAAIISYLPFYAPVLISDDWKVIVWGGVYDTISPMSLMDRRPLLGLLNNILWNTFGINVHVFYIVNFIFLVLGALLIYLIIYKLSPKLKWISLPITLLMMIYPVDYTRMWVTMFCIRGVLVLTLGAMLLLLNYSRQGGKFKFILALGMIILTLGIYEGQLGILFVWIIFLIFQVPALLKIRRISIILLFGLYPLFGFWRIWGQKLLFGINDPYVDVIQFNPLTIVNRFLHGIWIFISGWVKPFAYHFIRTEQKMSIYLFLFMLIFISLGIVILFRIRNNVNSSEIDCRPRLYIYIAVAGGISWFAGYIPIILAISPNLDTISSRVNIFAIPGASMFYIGLLGALFMCVLKSLQKTKILLWIALVPLFILGIIIQNWLDFANKSMWNEQKIIWNGIFQIAPNIKDDTLVVIVFDSINSPITFQHAPFIDDASTNWGIQVLYNNSSLNARTYFKDGSSGYSVKIDKDFVYPRTEAGIPYEQIMFFYYDSELKSLKLIENLSADLNLPFLTPVSYLPENRVSPFVSVSTEKYRYLVQ